MVKAIISTIIATILVIGLSIIEQNYLNKTFSEFSEILKCVQEKTEEETSVKEDVLSIQNFWIEKKKTLHVFIPHNDIKEIDLWIAEAVSLVENDNFLDALSKLEVVIELTQQIPKTYKFKLENIL